MHGRLKIVATIAGIIGVVVALITFLIDVRRMTNASVDAVRVAEQQRWDRIHPMLVYEAIRQHGEKGATFDEVRQGFVSRAAPYMSQLPQQGKEFEDAALRVALFDLIVAHVILPRDNNSYVAMDFSTAGYQSGIAAAELGLLLDQIDSLIVDIVVRQPGVHDRSSLIKQVKDTMKGRDPRGFARPDFSQLVEEEVSRAFGDDQFLVRGGKISSKHLETSDDSNQAKVP